MELAPSVSGTLDQWGVWPASPTPLFIGLAPLRRMHARPTHRTPPLRSAKARGSWKSGVALLNQIKGWDGSVRGKIVKGHFVQGMQHPIIFGRGHIGRGWTNIAPVNPHNVSPRNPTKGWIVRGRIVQGSYDHRKIVEDNAFGDASLRHLNKTQREEENIT
jgi:hypothetical protein